MHNECRIDHFRGFAGYWAVPAEDETAMGGTWRRGPGKDLFDALKEVWLSFLPPFLFLSFITPSNT